MSKLLRALPALILACSPAISAKIDDPDPKFTENSAENPDSSTNGTQPDPTDSGPPPSPTSTTDANSPPPPPPPKDASTPDTTPPPPSCGEKCIAAGQQCAPLASDTTCNCGNCLNANDVCSLQPQMAYGTCGRCVEQETVQCYELVQPAYRRQFALNCPYLPASRKCVVHSGVKCCE